MTEREQLARAALRDLEQVSFRELPELRERNPAAVQVWKSRNGRAIGIVQIKLRKDWTERLVPLSSRGVPRWPWPEEAHDKTIIHKVERLLAEPGGPSELLRLNFGAPDVINEAWNSGYLVQVTRATKGGNS